MLQPSRIGECSVLLSALLWSFFPVITILSYGKLFTLLVAYFFLREQPTLLQIASLFPIALGMFLLTKRRRDPSIASGDGVL